jgi:hypothetical protein
MTPKQPMGQSYPKNRLDADDRSRPNTTQWCQYFLEVIDASNGDKALEENSW